MPTCAHCGERDAIGMESWKRDPRDEKAIMVHVCASCRAEPERPRRRFGPPPKAPTLDRARIAARAYGEIGVTNAVIMREVGVSYRRAKDLLRRLVSDGDLTLVTKARGAAGQHVYRRPQ